MSDRLIFCCVAVRWYAYVCGYKGGLWELVYVHVGDTVIYGATGLTVS